MAALAASFYIIIFKLKQLYRRGSNDKQTIVEGDTQQMTINSLQANIRPYQMPRFTEMHFCQ